MTCIKHKYIIQNQFIVEMGILSIDIEWIKCVSAPRANHAMCHMAYDGW